MKPLLRPVLRAINDTRCKVWDLVHGVDTCGIVPLSRLEFDSANKSPGLQYQSHHHSLIRAGLMSLAVRHQDFTFIDVGCGKGRVMLIAAEFPFRKIIGLEFAPSLAECARQNLMRYRGRRRCREIEVVTGDATEYEFAGEPQVLYFFSPFAPEILERVVQRIEASFQEKPRELIVMFSGVIPMRDRGFGNRPQYERLLRSAHMDIYRHR